MIKEYDIFISYRREGGKEYARNLTSELVSRGFHPFLDFDELKDGKFDKRITDAIESAPVFMFILSPGSLDRCVNEDDWVRKEILHAIEHKRHFVPVDIDKQFEAFPSAENFPLEIKNALGQHQFSQIQTETLYKVSIDEMVKNRIQPAINEYMREKQKAAGMTGAEIHIDPDMDCRVQCSYEDMIVAEVSKKNVIRLPRGRHKLKFIAVENPEVNDSCVYKVEDETIVDFIEVKLKEKAGIIAINNDELERLQQEREILIAKIETLTLQLSKASADYEKLNGSSSDTIQSLNQEKECLQQQLDTAYKDVESKTKEIESLKKRLDDTQQALAKADTELKAYKEKEERERQAKFEAERKEAERKANEERERKAREAEARIKAEEEKKRGIIKVGNVEFKMIHVEGGTFTMGEGSDAHQVTLSSFYIGETPATQALWKEVTGKTPSRFNGDQRPVESVSWNDCQDFIKKLNAKTGKKFRLLTEAEWEFAARGGNKSKGYTYSGSDNINEVAWYEENSFKNGSSSPDYGTHPVKQKKPNELGIYDMSGNVWEWCQDWYDTYNKNSQTNPTGPASGSGRVFRGGSWYSDARLCRLSCRVNNSPDYAIYNLGFRLALSE